MENSIIITAHAKNRMKERLNIKSPERMQRIAQKAYEKGEGKEDLTGIRYRYLMQYTKGEKSVKLYNDQVFVFWEKILITVLPKDKRFQRNMEKKRSKAKKQQRR